VRNAIAASSGPENPVELSKRGVHSVKMDSRASLQNWKRRLSADEIARVRRLTEDVAQLYYPEESWNDRLRTTGVRCHALFQSGALLGKAIESVLAQDYPRVEYIVVTAVPPMAPEHDRELLSDWPGG